MSDQPAVCNLCGEPMPPGEEMFKYHGYSGPCPKSPLPKPAPAPESRVPGLKAQHAIITPTCRVNRGYTEAFDEAIRRLKNEYLACQGDANAGANFHVVLTVERPPEQP